MEEPTRRDDGRRRRSRRASATRATATTRSSRCMRIRGGKLLAREHQFLENIEEETDAAVLEAYLAGKYLPLEDRAARAARAVRSRASASCVEASLERTTIHAPQRGPRRELVDLATQNARHLLEELRLTGEESRGARRRSDLRAAAPARPAEGAALARRASTSRMRRERTPSRRASGSRTGGRIAPSIASSR